MELEQVKRMAVDAMVKYQNDEEIFQLAKALEELADYAEAVRGSTQERAAA